MLNYVAFVNLDVTGWWGLVLVSGVFGVLTCGCLFGFCMFG